MTSSSEVEYRPRTKNIERYIDSQGYNAVPRVMPWPHISKQSYTLKDGTLVALPHVVRLLPSPHLSNWLNANCAGWYSHLDHTYRRRKMPVDYFFEIERDAVLAKTFHGWL